MAIKECQIKDIATIKVGKDCRIYNNSNNFSKSVTGLYYLNITEFMSETNYSIFKTEININSKWDQSIYNDVIVCSRTGNTAGYFKLLKCRCVLDNRFNIIISNSDFVLSKYLLYWFQNKREKILSLQNNTTQPNITQKHLEELTINLPDLQTQQSIINIIEPFEKFLNAIKRKSFIFKEIKKILFFKMNKLKKFSEFQFIKNCKGKVLDINEGNYRYFNCSSNTSFTNQYNEFTKENLLIITTRGTITTHLIPKNNKFYGTNNLIIYSGEGINCFDIYFKKNNKKIINGTAIPMITKSDLNFLSFPYNESIEKILQKINDLLFEYCTIENKLNLIIKKLIELYVV